MVQHQGPHCASRSAAQDSQLIKDRRFIIAVRQVQTVNSQARRERGNVRLVEPLEAEYVRPGAARAARADVRLLGQRHIVEPVAPQRLLSNLFQRGPTASTLDRTQSKSHQDEGTNCQLSNASSVESVWRRHAKVHSKAAPRGDRRSRAGPAGPRRRSRHDEHRSQRRLVFDRRLHSRRPRRRRTPTDPAANPQGPSPADCGDATPPCSVDEVMSSATLTRLVTSCFTTSLACSPRWPSQRFPLACRPGRFPAPA